MSRIPHAVPGCVAAAIAVVLAVAGVEWIDTGTAPQPAAVNQPIAQRSPFAPVGDATRREQTVSPVALKSARRSDAPQVALAGDSRKLALNAVTALADVPGEQSESSLSDIALSHVDPAVREEAIYALGERGGVIARHTLQQALQDPSPRVREAAIRAIAGANAGDVASLGPALHAADVPTRLSAIDALGEMGGAEAAQYIEQMLRDENDVVREAAAEWMAELTQEP